MKNLKKFLSLLLIFVIFLCTNTVNASADTVYGNSNSNIKNGGLALKAGDYYYNVSPFETAEYSYDFYEDYFGTSGFAKINSCSIFKKKTPQGGIVKTIAKNALRTPFLNYRNGYIYYLGMSTTTGKPGVYRVKTNGTGMKRLADIYLLDYRCSKTTNLPMIIKDNYIYYCPNTDTIKRMSLTGTNKKTIYESPTWINSFSISGNYIYVNNNTHTGYFPDSKESIYRVTTSGSSKKNVYSSQRITDAVYYGGYIFYVNYNGLYRMNSDGSNKKCIVKTSNYIDYCIYNNKIYYTINRDLDDTSEITYLRCCSLSGSSKTRLYKYNNSFIHSIANGRVYLQNVAGTDIYNIDSRKTYFTWN